MAGQARQQTTANEVVLLVFEQNIPYDRFSGGEP